METFLTGLHISAALFMILVVLLQAGKGAGMGAAFGGSSQTVFGASGGMSVLSKLTAGAATIFMLTSMTLAYLSSTTDSVVDDVMQDAAEDARGDQKPPEIPEKADTPAMDVTPEAMAAPEGSKVIVKDKDGKPMPGVVLERVDPDALKKTGEAAGQAKEGSSKSNEPPSETQ